MLLIPDTKDLPLELREVCTDVVRIESNGKVIGWAGVQITQLIERGGYVWFQLETPPNLSELRAMRKLFFAYRSKWKNLLAGVPHNPVNERFAEFFGFTKIGEINKEYDLYGPDITPNGSVGRH